MQRAWAILLGIALLLPLAGPAAAVTASSCPIYPQDDVWHSLVQGLPVLPQSDTWIANMGGPTRLLHPDFGAYPYGYQLNVVDNTTPTTRVTFDYADESDQVPYPFTASTAIEPASDAHALMLNRDTCVLYEMFDASWNGGQPMAGSGATFDYADESDQIPYPFTASTAIEPASDAHALMLNRDTCVLYEMFDASWNGGQPTAGSGATFDLTKHDLRPLGWTSADAAGLPIWPGVLRYDEVARGLVDHAIRFTAQRTDKRFVWPARHQAGAANDPSLPPMGARFRLRSDFSLAGYSPQTQVVLLAMQRYGLILADNGSNFFFQGETSPNWSDQLLSELKTIPAGAFQAVDGSGLMIDPNSSRVTPAAARQPLVPGWHSAWQAQSPYLVMTPGQVADFWIQFSNSGTQPWVRGVWGQQANLGLNGDDRSPYALGMAANWLWQDRLATTTAAVVQPGDIAEFRFSVRAPMTRGVYRLNLRPVIDGTVWMEDQGVFWILDVR